MSDNGNNGGLGFLGWLVGSLIMGIVGFFFGKYAGEKELKEAFADGKAQGYKEASEEYEAKFRKQAEEFLSKTKEFEALIKQHNDENQALKEKINAYLEEGARLMGEYEGLKERYNEQNKKPSDKTKKQFLSLQKAQKTLYDIFAKSKKAA